MKRIDPGTVIGDNGLQIIIKYGSIMYIKNKRRVKIDTVVMNGFLNIGLSLVDGWLPPNQNDIFNDIIRSEVELDILNGMRLLDIDAKIV